MVRPPPVHLLRLAQRVPPTCRTSSAALRPSILESLGFNSIARAQVSIPSICSAHTRSVPSRPPTNSPHQANPPPARTPTPTLHLHNMSSSTSPLRHRRVVSSFICLNAPFTPSFRLTIFKRSGNVRTYPGKWAACSGSVEDSDASPRAAAIREIGEETGLSEDELELLVEAESFEIVDEGLGTRWEIYGFLWRWLGAGDGDVEGQVGRLRERIRLDWEHTEVKLVRPEEIGGMDTVQNLSKSVETALAQYKK